MSMSVLLLEQLTSEMMRRGDARRAEFQRTRPRLRVCDQLGGGIGRNCAVDRERDDIGARVRDRCEVLHRIEGHAAEEVDVRRHHGVGADQQSMAVGRRAGRERGANVSAGARPAVDDNGLAERGLELLADHTRERIARATWRLRRHDRDRPGRIGLGLRRLERARRRYRCRYCDRPAKCRHDLGSPDDFRNCREFLRITDVLANQARSSCRRRRRLRPQLLSPCTLFGCSASER